MIDLSRPALTPPPHRELLPAPGPVPHLPSDELADLDTALAVLHDHKDAWVATPLVDRIELLDTVRRDLHHAQQLWVDAVVEAKGSARHPMGVAEEWLNLAAIFRQIRVLRGALHDIGLFGRPHFPGPVVARPDGQLTVGVYPANSSDRMISPGVRAEVWMEPGVTAENLADHQAAIYRDHDHPGRICLVLGAGNISFLDVFTVLRKLFIEDKVVVLKLHPAMSYLGPLFSFALEALIRKGVLRLVAGGAEEGGYLCRHPQVDEVHLTGSRETFDTVVFGPGPDGAANKARCLPLLQKPITAELGGVTPVIVVPGPWSAPDVHRQADALATWFAHNASANCCTPRVIIQQLGWPQRHELLHATEQILSRVPARHTFYPGSREAYQRFIAAHPQIDRAGMAYPDELPWTIIPDLAPDSADEICFAEEAFCSLMAETALAASSPAAFLDAAVEFANERLWGSLGATIMIHPETLSDPQAAAALERAVANLRYGTVTVNYSLAQTQWIGVGPWGGFPGATIDNIQSGIGMANNLLMFDRPQKGVYRAPFHKRLDPFNVATRHLREFARDLARYEAEPSVAHLTQLGWSSLRG